MNPDYDPFASVRPKNTEESNVEIEDDNDPFAAARPSENELEFEENEPEEFSYGESVQDFLTQFGKEGVIGLGGTYGDLAAILGVKGGEIPGREEKSTREHDILTKMKEPGYKPSLYDLESLSDEGEGLGAFNLPTSESLREFNELVGGPGEAKTTAGKYGGRVGKNVGSTLAFGQPLATGSAAAAGVIGQHLEELGAPPLLQMAGEIATLLATGGKSGSMLASTKKEVQDKIKTLQRIGYTDEEITLAINASSKGKKFGIKASKGAKTEEAFESFSKHSDEMVSDILSSKVPGGPEKVHELASKAYGKVVDQASNLKIKNLDPFFDSMHSSMEKIKKSLGHNAEAKTFVKELTDHTLDIIENPTAANMIDFYKRLNGLGKWMGRSQKDHIIKEVKESIKNTFKAEGEEGVKLAKQFEKVNAGVKKAYQAQEAHELIMKASTQDGFDYNKLSKLFDKAENINLFEDVLGAVQTRNLKYIAKTGKEVKNFDKAWKATSLVSGTPLSLVGNLGYFLYSGNWVGMAAMKGGEAISRKLAEKSLTDPKFQNLMIRGLHAIKNEAPKAFRSVNDEMEKYLKEQDIEI